MVKEHPVEWDERMPVPIKTVDAVIPVEVDPDVRRIPIEDFGWKIVVTTTDEICYTNGTYYVKRKQVIEKITRRNENIKASFDIKSMAHAVKSLVPEIELDDITMQIIMMHRDGTLPEFHSFYLSDMTRENVKHYSRPDVDSEDCRWVTQSKAAAMRTINNHMRNLLPMLIEEGCGKLVPRMWQRSEMSIPVLVLLGDDEEDETRCIIFFTDFYDPLLCRFVAPSELIGCPESQPVLDHIQHLKGIVEKRKTNVLKVIKNYEMNPEAIDLFLKETRKIDVETN